MMRIRLWFCTAVLTALTGLTCGAERDIASIKACDIVTSEEAGKIIGGKLLTPPIPGYPHCRYVVEMPDGATEAYQLAFVSASMQESFFEFLAKEGKLEKIAGLWDEAYLGPQEFGEGFRLLVLKRGDVAFEVGGERKEPLLAMAQLVVERVKPPAEK